MFSAALAAVSNTDGAAHALIIHSIDFNRKREIIRAFATMGDRIPNAVAEVKELERLSKKAADLMDHRNTVAHGLMEEKDGVFKFYRIGVPALAKHLAKPDEALDVARLAQLTGKADAISDRLHEIEGAFERFHKQREHLLGVGPKAPQTAPSDEVHWK